MELHAKNSSILTELETHWIDTKYSAVSRVFEVLEVQSHPQNATRHYNAILNHNLI